MFDFIEKLLRKALDAVFLDSRRPVQAIPLPPRASSPATRPAANIDDSGDSTNLRFPLSVLLPGLPAQLLPRVRPGNTTALTVSLAVEMILPQLSRGTVKIPFGTLRQAAPGAFSSDTDCDNVLIPLPLPEILSRLKNHPILRRGSQKRLQVPDDVTGPFQRENRDLTISTAPATTPPVQFRSDRIPHQPAPPQSVAMPPGPSAKTPVPPHGSATGVDRASTPPKPEDESAFLIMLNLAALARDWPESLRLEMAQLNLADSQIALPIEAAREGLKRGRLAFTWKTLRSWLKPAVPPTVSARDGLTLELPLNLVAPLFLAKQRRPDRAKPKLVVEEGIPDLFSGQPPVPAVLPADTANPQPAHRQAAGALAVDQPLALPEAAKVAPPAEVEQPVLSLLTPVSPAADANHPAAPETGLGSSPSTPHSIVFRCVALKGVAGALIVSSEGLAVTSRLPNGVKADTLAAFVPQIFNRMGQCTHELAMGKLTNLIFTFGDVSWQIFRVRDLFLAVLGCTGEPLPAERLASLAAELEQPH